MQYSTEGCHYGEVAIQNGILSFASKVSGKGIFEMKLDNVEQCVVPQNNRSDLEIQFAESKEKNRDSVVKMVFHFPRKRKEAKEPKEKDNEDDEDEEEESEEEEETVAEAFRQQVMDNGIISSAAGEVLVEFTKDQGNFVSPRGKYALKVSHRLLSPRRSVMSVDFILAVAVVVCSSHPPRCKCWVHHTHSIFRTRTWTRRSFCRRARRVAMHL